MQTNIYKLFCTWNNWNKNALDDYEKHCYLYIFRDQ